MVMPSLPYLSHVRGSPGAAWRTTARRPSVEPSRLKHRAPELRAPLGLAHDQMETQPRELPRAGGHGNEATRTARAPSNRTTPSIRERRQHPPSSGGRWRRPFGSSRTWGHSSRCSCRLPSAWRSSQGGSSRRCACGSSGAAACGACACGSSAPAALWRAGWGRDGLGTGARGRGARTRRALMSTTRSILPESSCCTATSWATRIAE